jgi:hypothetical protein
LSNQQMLLYYQDMYSLTLVFFYYLELEDRMIQIPVLELLGKTMLTKFVKVEQLVSSMSISSTTLLELVV